MQGSGLGRKLLLRLIDAARANGISHLYALVLADNKRMITVLKHLGVPYREKRHLDTERIWLDLARKVDASPSSTGTPGESGHNQPGGATAPLTAREP